MLCASMPGWRGSGREAGEDKKTRRLPGFLQAVKRSYFGGSATGARAAKGGEVSAAAQGEAEFMGDGTDVRTRGTVNAEAGDGAFAVR